MSDPRKNTRDIFPPTGPELTAKSWMTEAPLRMLMNNLHPEVAENPHELVVYGGIGRAARTWEDFDSIVASLKDLEEDETLVVQSGKPIAIVKTHADAPRVLIANSNLVPHWATWDHFNELDKKGLAMYGQMTAGSWMACTPWPMRSAPISSMATRMLRVMPGTAGSPAWMVTPNPSRFARWNNGMNGSGSQSTSLSARSTPTNPSRCSNAKSSQFALTAAVCVRWRMHVEHTPTQNVACTQTFVYI